MSQTSVPLKSAMTTMEVLGALRDLDGAGVTEVADHLSMPTSSAHDYLRTLEREGYIVQENGVYRVGAWFLGTGEYYRSSKAIYEVGRPEVDEMAEETGEHANLMIEEHGLGVFLYRARGENAVELDTYSGMRVHLHTTSMGKAILAHRPRQEVEEVIDRHGLPQSTSSTVTNRDHLFEEFDRIREQGYATDDEERIKGTRCVAAPILSDDGRSLGAVSISAPKSRLYGDGFEEETPAIVMDHANVIQLNLTYG